VSGDEFDKLARDSLTTRGDESSARLEARVSELASGMEEERFIWSLVILVLFDCFMFEKSLLGALQSRPSGWRSF